MILDIFSLLLMAKYWRDNSTIRSHCHCMLILVGRPLQSVKCEKNLHLGCKWSSILTWVGLFWKKLSLSSYTLVLVGVSLILNTLKASVSFILSTLKVSVSLVVLITLKVSVSLVVLITLEVGVSLIILIIRKVSVSLIILITFKVSVSLIILIILKVSVSLIILIILKVSVSLMLITLTQCVLNKWLLLKSVWR